MQEQITIPYTLTIKNTSFKTFESVSILSEGHPDEVDISLEDVSLSWFLSAIKFEPLKVGWIYIEVDHPYDRYAKLQTYTALTFKDYLPKNRSVSYVIKPTKTASDTDSTKHIRHQFLLDENTDIFLNRLLPESEVKISFYPMKITNKSLTEEE